MVIISSSRGNQKTHQRRVWFKTICSSRLPRGPSVIRGESQGALTCYIMAYLEVYLDYVDTLAILVMFLVGCLTVAATFFRLRATISMPKSPTSSMIDHTIAEKETSGAEEETVEKKEGGMCFCAAGIAKLNKLLGETKNKGKDLHDNDEPDPSCKHTRVSKHGSNQYVRILKCKDCGLMLSKTPRLAAVD